MNESYTVEPFPLPPHEPAAVSPTAFLVTTGTGDHGDAWGVVGIFSTRERAEECQREYQRPRHRPDGSEYVYCCNIEEWYVDRY